LCNRTDWQISAVRFLTVAEQLMFRVEYGYLGAA
jgi:hypothetical protein